MGWGLGVGYDGASVLGSEVVGIPAAWESWLVTLEGSKGSRGPVNPSPLGKQWRHPVCVGVADASNSTGIKDHQREARASRF